MKEAAPRIMQDPRDPEDSRSPNGVPAPSVHVITMSELELARASPGEEAPPAGERGPPLLENLAELPGPLRQIKAQLTVCVGTAELTLGELLNARAQQVIRLDRTLEQPVDVLLEGQVIARGTLVAADDHFAVRITEVPLAGDATASLRKP